MEKHSTFVGFMLATMLIGQPVNAYKLSASKATSTLSGALSFVGGSEVFSCSVRMALKTHGERSGARIAAIHAKGKTFCNSVIFSTPPWEIEVQDMMGGKIDGGGWVSATGSCDETYTFFTIDSHGIWTFPAGDCIQGTLSSNPIITITPYENRIVR